MNYPTSDIKFKYYGKNVTSLLQKIQEEKDASTSKDLLIHTAKLMHLLYQEWNKENIDANTLRSHIQALSNNQCDLSEEDIQQYRVLEVTRRDRRKNNAPRRRNNNRRKDNN